MNRLKQGVCREEHAQVCLYTVLELDKSKALGVARLLVAGQMAFQHIAQLLKQTSQQRHILEALQTAPAFEASLADRPHQSAKSRTGMRLDDGHTQQLI